jgi:hypothetical protein
MKDITSLKYDVLQDIINSVQYLDKCIYNSVDSTGVGFDKDGKPTNFDLSKALNISSELLEYLKKLRDNKHFRDSENVKVIFDKNNRKDDE